MAKRISQLTELTSGQVAQDDYLPIVDTSAGVTKKVKVSTLTGSPDFGWSATGESWSYNAWDATIRQATITVPSDATTKYSEGMFVRFSQTTGGTKYGIIMAVTATTLVVLLKSGQTLNNEAISSPVYSPLRTPYGISVDPDDWALELTATSQDTQTTPTTNTCYNIGSRSLAVGLGKWLLGYNADAQCNGNTNVNAVVSLSTSASSESDKRFSASYYDGPATGSVAIQSTYKVRRISLAAKTTYYLIQKAEEAAGSIHWRGDRATTVIRAIPAVLGGA